MDLWIIASSIHHEVHGKKVHGNLVLSEVSDAIYLIRAPAKENSRMGCLTDNKSLFEGNIKTSIRLKYLFRLIFFFKKKDLIFSKIKWCTFW